MPAECFHISEFIQDELDARGWTIRDLAERMGGDVGRNELSIDLLFAVADHPEFSVQMHIGDVAEQLANAFGGEAETWRNLEAAYIEWRRIQNN